MLVALFCVWSIEELRWADDLGPVSSLPHFRSICGSWCVGFWKVSGGEGTDWFSSFQKAGQSGEWWWGRVTSRACIDVLSVIICQWKRKFLAHLAAWKNVCDPVEVALASSAYRRGCRICWHSASLKKPHSCIWQGVIVTRVYNFYRVLFQAKVVEYSDLERHRPKQTRVPHHSGTSSNGVQSGTTPTLTTTNVKRFKKVIMSLSLRYWVLGKVRTHKWWEFVISFQDDNGLMQWLQRVDTAAFILRQHS